MRLLLVGAFPYPFAQGSQVYFQEQARALHEAGAAVELLTYATGDRAGADTARAVADFVHHTPAAWTAPKKLRSGPTIGKPLADAALAIALRRLVRSDASGASSASAASDASGASSASAASDGSFDAVLTHNAEAGLAALWALRGSDCPLVYCVHTLLGQELSAYFRVLKSDVPGGSERGPRRAIRRAIDRAGQSIDALLARRADAWIALTHESSRVMRADSNRPGALIPPPIPDPQIDEQARRTEADALATRFGLDSNHYFLYSGNLDGYQEIEVLADAAAMLTRTAVASSAPVRIVVASHDARAPERIAQLPGLEARAVGSSDEMLALIRHARACILMRTAEGGYPIKLVNAHAVGTPTIAFRGREWGLVDGQNALLANLDRPAASLADAILRLRQDDALAEALGRGARALYLERHRPSVVAEQSLELIEAAIEGRRGQAGSY